MPISIIENGLDLLLTNPTTDQNVYLHNPPWRDVLRTLRDFTNIAEIGHPTITGPEVGIYQYNSMIDEHMLTFYPNRATPNGWIATHLGTRYANYVEVHENSEGTIIMLRDNLKQWTATHLPQPGAFFEALQALSGPDEPNLEWSSDDLNGGQIVAVVDIDPDIDDEIAVILYPDVWDEAMRRFVMG